jgi:hypothetical protein
MRSERPSYLFYLIRMYFRFFLLNRIVNTLDIFDILEYPLVINALDIHNLLSRLHGIVSNEMTFNLLCDYVGKYYYLAQCNLQCSKL